VSRPHKICSRQCREKYKQIRQTTLQVHGYTLDAINHDTERILVLSTMTRKAFNAAGLVLSVITRLDINFPWLGPLAGDMDATRHKVLRRRHGELMKCQKKQTKEEENMLGEDTLRSQNARPRGPQLFEISYTCFEILFEIQEITEFKILSRVTIQNQEPWERSQTKPGAV